MQVNGSAKIVNPAAEPVSGSTRPPERDSSNSFFAQIDEMWNSGAQEEPDTGESSGQFSNTAARGFYHLNAGAGLPGNLDDAPETGDQNPVSGPASADTYCMNSPCLISLVENATPGLAGAESVPVETGPISVTQIFEALLAQPSVDTKQDDLPPVPHETAVLSAASPAGPVIMSTVADKNTDPRGTAAPMGERITAPPPISRAGGAGSEPRIEGNKIEAEQTRTETGFPGKSNITANDPESKREDDSIWDKVFGSGNRVPDTKTKYVAEPVWPETTNSEPRQANLGYESPLLPDSPAQKASVSISESIVAGADEFKPLFEKGAAAQVPKGDANNSELGAGHEGSQSDPSTMQRKRTESSRMNFGSTSVQAGEKQEKFSFQHVAASMSPMESGAAAVSARSEAGAARPPEFLVQLAERIQVQLRDGKNEIRIQLRPDSLGRLEIRAENTSNGVVARILAESAAVKNYLESNLHVLQHSLQDQGLKIERIQVSVQDNSGYAAQSGHAGPEHGARDLDRTYQDSTLSGGNQPEDLSIDPAAWIALNPNIRFHTVA